MQRRASKHFLSTLKAHLSSANTHSHFSLYIPLAHLSSNPRRSFRGRKDDQFSENRNFIRGQRENQRENIGPDDFFSKTREKDRDLGAKSHPIEGEKPKGQFGYFTESDDEQELQSSPQFQPSNPQFHIENEKNEKIEKTEKPKPLSGLGESLFEKLKLGDKKPDPSQAQPTRSETLNPKGEQKSDPSQVQPTRLETETLNPNPSQNADEIFRKMKETGLIPNAVSMLDGLCKDGLVHEAMKLFALMREKGSIPDVVIYTAVVDGFCKAGKCEDGKRIFRKMQKNGIIPNAYSYGLIVNWLCNLGELEDCLGFCEEMFEAGHSPNAETFVRVLGRVCRERGREEGERVVKRFQERNFAIDERSVREFLDKKGPFDLVVSEVIFGKKGSF